MPKKGQSGLPIAEFNARLIGVPEMDWARLAAFIDSEGTVYINRTLPKTSKNVVHGLSVALPNTSVALMDWLTSTFGGSVNRKELGVNAPCFEWRVNNLQAASVLRGCVPWMIIKREQAVLGIALQDSKRWGNNRVDAATLTHRDETARKIKQLNAEIDPSFCPRLPVDASIAAFEKNINLASVTDLARLASFIDAEGTIYINASDKKGRVNRQFSLSVCVVNSSPLLLNWLTGTFGGRIYRHSSMSRKQCWMWKLNSAQSEIVLTHCLPFFMVKRRQAEIGIAFRKLMDSTNKFKVSEKEIRARQEMRDKIHVLNSPHLAQKKIV